MELRYSRPTDASWAFAVADHSRAAQLMFDGRYRDDICRRAGNELRCEVRGLFPGGHSVELRVAGAVLKRSVVVSRPWPKRPLLVRVHEAQAAADAIGDGADGVVFDGNDVDAARDVVDAAHEKGGRAFVSSADLTIGATGADGFYGRSLDAETLRRFPESRVLVRSGDAKALGEFLASGDPRALLAVHGVLETATAADAPFALLAPDGVLTEGKKDELVTLLRARRKQKTLHDGNAKLVSAADRHIVVELQAGTEILVVAVNLGTEPWRYVPQTVTQPLDLLGSSLEGNAIVIRPHDIAWIVKLPGKDPTRY